MITIRNLVKKYNNIKALDIPLLEIKKNEIVGVVGNNGAGKTTLLRLMLDLIKPDKGIIELNNIQVKHDEKWKAFTGSYLDESFLIDYLTPHEYMKFVGYLYGKTNEEINAGLLEYEEFTGKELLQQGKYIRQLSSGNKQKTGIVASMFITPKILLLDEPHANLDPTSQIILRKKILKLNKDRGTTILLSSHDMNFVSEICTRVILLEGGVVMNDIKSDNATLNVLLNYFEPK